MQINVSTSLNAPNQINETGNITIIGFYVVCSHIAFKRKKALAQIFHIGDLRCFSYDVEKQ